RGTIVSLKPIPLLPTFSYAATYNPTFLRLYARRLEALGCTLPHEERQGAYRRYTGDAAVPGRGEILVWQPRAWTLPSRELRCTTSAAEARDESEPSRGNRLSCARAVEARLGASFIRRGIRRE